MTDTFAIFRAVLFAGGISIVLAACQKAQEAPAVRVHSARTQLTAVSYHLETCTALNRENPVPVQTIIDFEYQFESFTKPIDIEPGTPVQLSTELENTRLAFVKCLTDLKSRIYSKP